jgi:glucokinase
VTGAVLVADVGGTNTRFARFGQGGLLSEERWPTSEVPTLAGGVARYLALHPGPVESSCVAVAGPVHGDVARLTNTPWHGRVEDLPGRGCFVNDLQAAAAAVTLLGPDDRVVLREAPLDPAAPRAVLGLGTGLGEAIGLGTRVIPGEGGHKTFGPADAEQRALAGWLAASLGRAPSWEDVLSGAGLGRCLAFIRERARGPVGTGLDALAIEATHSPDRPDCAAALMLYASCCAVEARNLGLQVLARGGVWLAGGMPARIPDAVWRAAFASHFALDGPMREQADALPVLRVRHEALNLLGAAVLASA